MEKVIWSDTSLDYGEHVGDAGGLNAARGLLIGLAISPIFWIVLAYFIF